MRPNDGKRPSTPGPSVPVEREVFVMALFALAGEVNDPTDRLFVRLPGRLLGTMAKLVAEMVRPGGG